MYMYYIYAEYIANLPFIALHENGIVFIVN
jgi:hypothetical protein